MNRDSKHILAALAGLCGALALISCKPPADSARPMAVVLPSGDLAAPEPRPGDANVCDTLRATVRMNSETQEDRERRDLQIFGYLTESVSESRRVNSCAVASVEAFCLGTKAPERCD